MTFFIHKIHQLLFVLLLSLFCTPEIICQTNFELTKSEGLNEFIWDRNEKIWSVYRSNDGNDLTLYRYKGYGKRRKRFLQSINQNLKSSPAMLQDTKLENKRLYFKTLLIYRNRQFGVYHPGLSKKDLNTDRPIYLRELNSLCEPVSEFKQIGAFPYQATYSRRNRFHKAQSPDRSKVLLTTTVKRGSSTHEDLGLVILDEELNPIKSFEVSIPRKQVSNESKSVLSTISSFISDEGDVTLTCYYKGPSDSPWGYHIYHFDAEKTRDGVLIENPPFQFMETQQERVSACKIIPKEGGGYSCHGTYSINKDDAIGVFYGTIDDGRFSVSERYEFSDELILQGESEKDRLRRLKKEEPGHERDFPKLKLRKVHKMETGYVLVLEKSWITYTESYDPDSGRTWEVYHYHTGDIVLVKMSFTGNVQWTKKILKYQHSKKQNKELSFISVMNHDKLHLIYNGNWKDEGVTEFNSLKGYEGKKSDSAVVLLSIDDSGIVQRQNLWKAIDDPTFLVPSILNPAFPHDNHIFLPVISGRKVSFWDLELK